MQNSDRSIQTARLRVVPFSESYLTPRYVGWLNDPLVVRYSEQRHQVHTLESCRAYWDSFAGSTNQFWAIVLRDSKLEQLLLAQRQCDNSQLEEEHLDFSNSHIGNVTAYIDEVNAVADLGIMIGERSIWNRGYGVEAWTAVCQHLLCDRGLRKITAGTMCVNTAMLGIMRRSGMREDGRRIRQCVFEDQEIDVVYAALFRDNVRQVLDQKC